MIAILVGLLNSISLILLGLVVSRDQKTRKMTEQMHATMDEFLLERLKEIDEWRKAPEIRDRI